MHYKIFIILGGEDKRKLRSKYFVDIYDSLEEIDKNRTIIICSGHAGFEWVVNETEAKQIKKYLIENGIKEEKIILENGIKEEKIILEEHSMETLGNAYFSLEIVEQIYKESKIPIEVHVITGKEHYRRAVNDFKKVKKCFFEDNPDIIIINNENNLPSEKKKTDIFNRIKNLGIWEDILRDFNALYHINNKETLGKYLYSLPIYHIVTILYTVPKFLKDKQKLFENEVGYNKDVYEKSHYSGLQRLYLKRKRWYKEYLKENN